MKIVLVGLAILLCPSVNARNVFAIGSGKQFPVTKVVILLKDMQAQMEKEAEEDEEVYDKMACWCKTNDREKTESIKNAETRTADLTTMIESSAAASGRLKTEIANHEADLSKAQKSLDQLTAIRTKQAKEFNSEEKDMLQSIKALESAIVVLSKHHGNASPADNAVLGQIAEVVRAQMDKHKMMLLGIITPHQKRIMGFMQEGSRQPQAQFRAYRPQSSEIFGILRQMKETFQANLSDSQKEEQANAKAYEEQKSAKEDEIKAISNSVNQKKTQLAKSDELNAQSKEDLEDTQNSLSSDDNFLIDLKERCKLIDQEWQTRQKARQGELTAISEAIAILSSDAARDNFSKTFNAGATSSFLQKKVSRRIKHSDARHEVALLLRAAAAKVGKPALAGLAVAAELDAFKKVKEAIDKMVKELQEENAVEIQTRDSCIDMLNENTLLTEKETRKKSDTEMKVAGLQNDIKELTTSIETLEKEVAEMNLQIKRAGEDRELANKDFQATIIDQRETQKLLNKAIKVLKAVYTKEEVSKAAALAVESSEVRQQPPPPPGFKDYSQNAGGGGAVALLVQILGDAKVMEAEATKDEQTAQQTYEKFVKDSNNAIATKSTAIVNKRQDRASAEQDLGTAKTDLEEQTAELLSLSNAKSDLNLKCDFLMKNFDVRQQARADEIEALRQAKAILSGMQLDE